MNKEVLVIGAGGLVGSRFVQLTKFPTEVISGSNELDITDPTAVKERIERFSGDVVVNFAAMTDVDGAEKEESELAWRVNADGPENLAEACEEEGKFLVHLSTDFVFPGNEDYPGPYFEDERDIFTSVFGDEPEGLSWYGWTKLVGETRVEETLEESAIVRISYPYRTDYNGKLDFARGILSRFNQGKLYPMFTDQELTPTYIDELVGVIDVIVDNPIPGIFHVASSNLTTPYEFARYLINRVGGDQDEVKPGCMVDYLSKNSATPRPRLGGLEVRCTEIDLGINLMTWQEAVDKFVEQL